MKFRTLIGWLPTLLAVGILMAQEESDWKIGLAKAEITPSKPIRMAGYASRTQPSESATHGLYAKAMAVEDRGGNRAVLITADTLGFPGEIAGHICDRITAATGLTRKAILINGSHTHAGPLIWPRLGYPLAEPEEKVIVEYGTELEQKIAAIAKTALNDLRPVRLAWGTGVANFVMNRREFTPRGVILGVNPRGPADRSVPVLRVEAADGTLRAVVFGAACHNTTLTGDNLHIDGDYCGYAQSYLEERHPGLQAMFMMGCGADANPYPRGTLELAREHGHALGQEVDRVLAEKLKPVGGPIRTELRRVDLPLQRFTRAEIEQAAKDAPSYRRFFVEGALRRLDEGKPLLESYNAPFALWQFGNDLTLVAFSGETVVDYVRLAEQALGPLNLWVAGYSNDLYGYLVTSRLLEEGGYETRGLYTDLGLFAPGVEKVVMSAVVNMARAAGRPVH